MSKHTIKSTKTWSANYVDVKASKAAGVADFKPGRSWDDRTVTARHDVTTHHLDSRELGLRINISIIERQKNVEVQLIKNERGTKRPIVMLCKKVAPAKVEALVAAILNGDHDPK